LGDRLAEDGAKPLAHRAGRSIDLVIYVDELQGLVIDIYVQHQA
jgi:hypothetical protein